MLYKLRVYHRDKAIHSQIKFYLGARCERRTRNREIFYDEQHSFLVRLFLKVTRHASRDNVSAVDEHVLPGYISVEQPARMFAIKGGKLKNFLPDIKCRYSCVVKFSRYPARRLDATVHVSTGIPAKETGGSIEDLGFSIFHSTRSANARLR